MFARRRRISDVRKHFSAFRNNLSALQRDARELANDVSDLTIGNANRATKWAGAALDTVSTSMDGLNTIKPVRRAMKNQPLAAIAISVGTGVIIGAFLSRR